MERLMKTKIEIIEETVAYYSEDVNRRALGELGGCAYLTEDGRMCAVGRCEIDPPKYDEGGPAKTGSYQNGIAAADDRSEIKFKPEYEGHEMKFWEDLQSLHDEDDYWNANGISERGMDYAEELKKKYENNS